MDDEAILARGGTEDDIKEYAKQNGADLELRDTIPEDERCGTCDGYGKVVQNAGYCGGCERCGSIEEKETTCPDCNGSGRRED